MLQYGMYSHGQDVVGRCPAHAKIRRSWEDAKLALVEYERGI